MAFNPGTIRTATWWFGNCDTYRMIVLKFFHAYPKKYMPLQVWQQGYLGPSHTIVHLLLNMHKTNLLVQSS